MGQKDREHRQSEPGLNETFKTRGGYRINLDGSISFFPEVQREKEQENATKTKS